MRLPAKPYKERRATATPRQGVVCVEQLRLSGFRGFPNARLPLDDLIVLVGRNGAGKSTLINAFELMRDALSDSLENALERHGGFGSLRFQEPRQHAGEVGVAVELTLFTDYVHEIAEEMGRPVPDLPHPVPSAPEVPVLYGFRLGPKRSGAGFVVVEEAITLHDNRRHFERHGERRPLPRFAPTSLALPTLAGGDPLARAVLGALQGGIRAYCLSRAAIRAEPPLGQGSQLQYDGRNVGDVLKHLQSSPPAMSWILRHLQGIMPGVVDLRAGAAAGRRTLRFVQEGQSGVLRSFGVGEVSDGTLRGLAVLLALSQRPTPSLICIDEIEDSIHPGALAVLLDAAEASTEHSRILLTTHSPEALSHPAITGRRVRVIEWRAGRSEVFGLGPGAEELLIPPRTVGSLLRTNALWTAEEPYTVGGDLLSFER